MRATAGAPHCRETSDMTAGPVEGVFALLDVLLGRAALIVELHHPIQLHGQVGDDEADLWKQLAQVPFDLSDHPAFLAPGRRLIVEILEEPFDLSPDLVTLLKKAIARPPKVSISISITVFVKAFNIIINGIRSNLGSPWRYLLC